VIGVDPELSLAADRVPVAWTEVGAVAPDPKRGIKYDHSSKRGIRTHLDWMVCELDGGIILVRSHRKTRHHTGGMDLPRRHFYWSHVNGALDCAGFWREPNLGSWR